MSTAKLRVAQAGPLVSIQDAGRFGALRFGVSAAGPMDRLSFSSANAALGRELGATSIEVSLGGVSLDCIQGAATLAVAGGDFTSKLDTQNLSRWQVVTLEQGQSLSIRGGSWGSWCYVAVAGALQANEWLGSTATASMTNFGGGALFAGQILTISDAQVLPSREGEISRPATAAPPTSIRVNLGPQDRHFADEKIEMLQSEPFCVSGAYDRMGMRLDGPPLSPDGALSIPSEPILRGSVQVSGDGVATVLLADHGTTGGYPKIATVLLEDQDRLVQLRSGSSFRFVAVSSEEALQVAREEARMRSTYLSGLAQPKPSLQERLMQENLVGGVVSETPD
ncbi:MAG: biotin-dependent carboxyltransferase family protein [Pseudomonadota bacterium]